MHICACCGCFTIPCTIFMMLAKNIRDIYPNALAVMRLSTQNYSIVDVENLQDTQNVETDMARKSKKTRKNGRSADENEESQSSMTPANDAAESVSSSESESRPDVDEIWKQLGKKRIELSYACVGYTLDGRPILNYDDFMNLLVSYGFECSSATAFIDDFAENAQEDGQSPIVMISGNSCKIMNDITPLKS